MRSARPPCGYCEPGEPCSPRCIGLARGYGYVAGLCDGTLSERATLDRLGDLAADVLDLLLDGRVLPPEPERIEQHRRVIGHLRAIASSTARRRAAR